MQKAIIELPSSTATTSTTTTTIATSDSSIHFPKFNGV